MINKVTSYTWFLTFLFILGTVCFASQNKCIPVADRDTITVMPNDNKFRIRLVGIDAPEKSRRKHEPGQPFSQNFTKCLASFV